MVTRPGPTIVKVPPLTVATEGAELSKETVNPESDVAVRLRLPILLSTELIRLKVMLCVALVMFTVTSVGWAKE